MPSGIYVWKLNGVPKYVGKGVDVHQRMNRNHSDTKALSRAISKVGIGAFEREIVCYCETEELNRLEQYYIRELHTHRSENGYNLTWGGDGVGAGEDHPLHGITGEAHPSWGMKRSKETVARLSESHKGIKLSEDAKQKIADSKRGKPNPFFGLKSKRATSSCFGVSKVGERFRSLITVNGGLNHLGYFVTEAEAAITDNRYVLENNLKDYPLNEV